MSGGARGCARQAWPQEGVEKENIEEKNAKEKDFEEKNFEEKGEEKETGQKARHGETGRWNRWRVNTRCTVTAS
jgi:hypothetical protein